MNARDFFMGCVTAAMVVLGSSVHAAPLLQAEDEEGIEVLTRGPVHEAFAETVTFDPEPGIIVPNAPPEAIEELPPEQRPEGANVQWIPGYSAWDDDREDFLWVSGIWRDLPPGRQWVPGYWTEVEEGFQWISGYWADASLSEIQYLPEPPATAEVGPNIAAPSPDHSWLPGCWIWHENRYAWRPGYWAPVQTDWDWIPAHYVWCPRGYVFVDGYNDYSVDRRGVLFAPVYLNSGFYSRRDYTYSPSIVINLGQFTSHLFSRPRYSHYYFGDYYEASYNTAGYYPWFSYNSSGRGYDPFYARQRWQHRQDNDWHQRIERDYGHRRDNENARPPRTLAAQIVQNKITVNTTDQIPQMALPLAELTKSQDTKQRFQTIDKNERQQLAQRGQEIQKFRKERQQLEAKEAVAATEAPDSGRSIKPSQVKLPKSPIAAKPQDTPGVDGAIPKPPVTPELDMKVEPKPRPAREATQIPKVKKDTPKSSGVDKKPPVKNDKSKKNNEPNSGKKSEPKPDQPKADPANPKPDQPKADPKPDRPKVNPKPDQPKVEPKPDKPKADPKPDRPKAEPKPDRPKVEPKPDRPKVEPKPDRPKVEPKPDRPKAEPKLDKPKMEPKPDQPKG